jgi:hypothetical protein
MKPDKWHSIKSERSIKEEINFASKVLKNTSNIVYILSRYNVQNDWEGEIISVNVLQKISGDQ